MDDLFAQNFSADNKVPKSTSLEDLQQQSLSAYSIDQSSYGAADASNSYYQVNFFNRF